MEIPRIIWLEDIVEKLIWKHNDHEEGIIEVLDNKPRFQRKEKGHRPGEDVYVAFGRTRTNRYLSVFFVYTRDKQAVIVSARDMTNKERRKHDKKIIHFKSRNIP